MDLLTLFDYGKSTDSSMEPNIGELASSSQSDTIW